MKISEKSTLKSCSWNSLGDLAPIFLDGFLQNVQLFIPRESSIAKTTLVCKTTIIYVVCHPSNQRRVSFKFHSG